MTIDTGTPTTADRRSPTRRDPVTMWLLMVAALVFLMVVVGGFVRLSRAGLSIVEWDVVVGVVPPIGEDAWQAEFELYQQTPEYQIVNRGMTLSEFRYIFYLEWAHRLIGRIAGLLVVVPLIVFLIRGVVSFRESLKYWAIAALFGIQGAIGWVMVASGLVDKPVVSDVRLTIHLLAAVTLMSLVLWMAMDRMARTAPPPPPLRTRALRPLVWTTLGVTVAQIALGGIVAGLKAGHVSTTWPLMYGMWIPSNLTEGADTALLFILEPIGSHWAHRWLAFLVAGLVAAVVTLVLRHQRDDRTLTAVAWTMAGLVMAQIVLGIFTVLLNVPKWWALAHQGVGVLLIASIVVATHRVLSASRVPARTPAVR